MRVSISISKLNRLLEYVGTKPYIEVADLIKEIHEDAKEIKDSEPEVNFITLPAENI